MTEDTTVSPELEFDATHPIYTNKRKTEVPGTVLSCAADNCGCSTHFFSLPRLVSRLLPQRPRILAKPVRAASRRWVQDFDAALRSNNDFSVEI